MAKAKKTEAEPKNFSDIVLQEIDRQFGAVASSGDAVVTEDRTVIPMSPVVDPLIGGGIPEGSWVTISGKYGSGKSTAALRFAANAQKPEYGSRDIFYLDIEGRWDQANQGGTRGLITTKPRFNVIGSTEDKILSAEDFIRIADIIINSCPRVVVIFDSPSMFASEDSRSQGVEYQNRGQINKTLSEFVRQNSQVVRVRKSTVISCIHLQKTQGHAAGWDEKIAEVLNYAANLKLRIRWDERWCIGTKEKQTQIGQILHWEVDKSRVGSGAKADGYLRYGQGIDVTYESLMSAIDLGVVEKAGAWYSFAFMQEPEKFQGLENAWATLDGNPDLTKQMIDAVYKMTNPEAA